jgi:hypothetical protein
MRGTFRLVLATILALACGAAFASDPVASESTAFKDSFPDAVSYPATVVDSRLEGPIADSIQQAAVRSLGVGVSTQTYVSQPHPLFAALLPDASFLRTKVDAPPEFQTTNSHVQMAGKRYRLESLNRLLLDAGFAFDSTEMRTMAKIAVLFATFGWKFDTSGNLAFGREPTNSTPGDGFPAITFLSVKRGEWLPPHLKGPFNVRRGLYVDCLVDGSRVPMFVGFTGNRHPQPDEVFTLSDVFLGSYDYAWPNDH